MTQPSHKIGLAGCGKMGASMLAAWLTSELAQQVFVLDPNGVPPELLSDSRIVYCANEGIFLGHASAMDILVLAVKPQTMDELCAALKTHLSADIPVLSIAAGRTIASLQNHFGASQPIIRAMPNTPASIGKGMIVACPASGVSGEQKNMANAILSPLGIIEWIGDEKLMDAVTALSGSGPAYLFYLIECMARAGIAAGLEPEFAQRLARQTVTGSAALAENMNEIAPEILRENVTSPNGTTAAALEILMDGRFQTLLNEAIAAAAKRSKELSK